MRELQISIREELRSAAVPGRVEYFRKIVPGAGEVLGTPTPAINALARKYKSYGSQLAVFLWKSEFYEERLLAAKILVAVAGKHPDDAIAITRSFAADLKDWSICDTLGMGVSKALRKKRKDEILELSDELLHEKSFWQRRLGLVLLECFTKDISMHGYIRERIALVTHEKEHYIKKAITWLNRAMQAAEKKAGL
jgi:3-methyladenine DNA glycosylase AlkD